LQKTYAQLAGIMLLYYTDTEFCAELIQKPILECRPDQTLHIQLQLKFIYKKFQN